MDLLALLILYRYVVIAIVASIAVLYWAFKNWSGIMFWSMNFFYRWPFVGRMSIHKRLLHRNNADGWYDGEKRLCEDFYPRYKRFSDITATNYNNCKSYLAQAGETGRKFRSEWIWVVLAMFVIGEAAIFAKLILSFAGELSNNDIKWVSFVIAFLLAMVLLFVTEKTGHELYTNSQIKKIRLWHAEDDTPEHKTPRPNLHVRLDTTSIDLNDKDYQQVLNRIGGINAQVKPTYWWSMGTLTLIVIIAIIAFVERAALNSEMIEESATGAYGSYLFYSLVFLAIQAMGIGLGYLYGFASKEGKKAYLATYKFMSSEDYLRWPKRKAEHVDELAQNRLGHLQKYILKKLSNTDEINIIEDMHNRTFRRHITKQNEI